MGNVKDLTKLGTLYCTLSAVAYTAYNLCLRYVSEDYDPAWVNCVQASVSVVIFGAYLAWQASRGRPSLPPWGELIAMLIIGMITQVGGILLVWAMGVVGAAITVTLQTGIMLGASAILGLIVLGERVSWPQIIAIALITAAIVFFSLGAETTDAAVPGQPLSTRGLLGIAAGALSGIAFAILTVGIRKTVTSHTTPEAIVFLMNVMGVVALGPWCVYQLGADTLVQTSPRDLGVMLGAGAMNLVAFLLVTMSLQMITVVRVNVLNNGLSTALTAIVGIVYLSEPRNGYVLGGIALSVVGILIISLVPPPPEPETKSEVEPEPSLG